MAGLRHALGRHRKMNRKKAWRPAKTGPSRPGERAGSKGFRPAKWNAVLFDIDGVLVDVRRSYIDAIRKTVDLYLQKILLVPAYSGFLLSREDINRFKLLGGFNNDWDAVYGILLYLQSQVEKGPRKWEVLTVKKLRQLMNLKRLAQSVPRPCGIQPVKKLVKNPGLISYALGKDMFQEIYLGEKLFKKDEGRNPLFSRTAGLIHFEKLFFPKTLLKKLKVLGFSLGIVTGRTRFEAEYVLKRFNIREFFKAIITHDDVTLRKPHPFPVLACARKIAGGWPGPIRSGRHLRLGQIGRRRSFIYVGDLPDDIRAANASKKTIRILSCGVLYGQDEPGKAEQAFKKAGVDFLIARPVDLLSAIRGK